MVTELTFPSVTVESVPFAIQAGTFPARLIIRQYAKRQNKTILEKVQIPYGPEIFSGPIFNHYFSSVVSCEDLLNSSKCVTTISLTVNLVKFRANWHKHDKVDKVVRKHSYCAFYRVSNCSRDEETSHVLGKATHKKTWLNSVLINV